MFLELARMQIERLVTSCHRYKGVILGVLKEVAQRMMRENESCTFVFVFRVFSCIFIGFAPAIAILPSRTLQEFMVMGLHFFIVIGTKAEGPVNTNHKIGSISKLKKRSEEVIEK